MRRRSKPTLSRRQQVVRPARASAALDHLPPPPAGLLPPEATEAWQLLGQAAVAARTLRVSDLPALALAAIGWREMIQAIGLGDSRAASAWYGRLSVLLSQLGLTPRGRQLVPVEGDEQQDAENPFSALLRGDS